MIFVCHVTLQDHVHVIRALFDFMIKSHSRHHPSKFCGHRICGSGDIIVLVCHEISQDQVIKGLCNFMGGNPSW